MITFDAWYRNFPKKCAKKDAEKAWNGLTEEQHDAAAAALPNHVLYWHAHGTEMHYIPLPATWLRGWRWEDVLIFERRQTARPETPQEHRANNVATLTGRRHDQQRAPEPDPDGTPVSEFPLTLRQSR